MPLPARAVAALGAFGIGCVMSRRPCLALAEPDAVLCADTASIGRVFSRARRSRPAAGLTGRVSLEGVELDDDILDAVAPVGIIIVGSCAVSFFRGVAGRPDSEGLLSPGERGERDEVCSRG